MNRLYQLSIKVFLLCIHSTCSFRNYGSWWAIRNPSWGAETAATRALRDPPVPHGASEEASRTAMRNVCCIQTLRMKWNETWKKRQTIHWMNKHKLCGLVCNCTRRNAKNTLHYRAEHTLDSNRNVFTIALGVGKYVRNTSILPRTCIHFYGKGKVVAVETLALA